MSRVYLLLAIVGIAVIIYSFIDAVRADRRDVRSIPKAAWLVVIVLLPVIGTIMWFALGRPVYRPGPSRRPAARPMAPDDDPDFLRNLELRRRRQAREDGPKRNVPRSETPKHDDGGTRPAPERDSSLGREEPDAGSK